MTPNLAAAYGGGGLFGIAYLLGVGEALIADGVPLATTPSVGTSAGSWAAAAFALDVRWHDAIDLLADDVPRWPDPRPGRLRNVAAKVLGERRVPTMRVVACALPRLQRVLLPGADHAAADLVAASSAVPGLLAPHQIDGRRYVDGGVRSLVSADLADDARHLLVIAPIAGPMLGPGGRFAERIVRRETQEWEQAHPGGKVWLIRPNQAVAEIARWPRQLFDTDRAKRCYDLAHEQTTRIMSQWRRSGADEGTR